MNGRRWPPLPCLITFTSSLHLRTATPRLPRFQNGSNGGSTKNIVNLIVGFLCQTADPQIKPGNGRKAVSTACCGLTNRSPINGNTCDKTPFARAWSLAPTIGHTSSRLQEPNCRAAGSAATGSEALTRNALQSEPQRVRGASQKRPTIRATESVAFHRNALQSGPQSQRRYFASS